MLGDCHGQIDHLVFVMKAASVAWPDQKSCLIQSSSFALELYYEVLVRWKTLVAVVVVVLAAVPVAVAVLVVAVLVELLPPHLQ